MFYGVRLVLWLGRDILGKRGLRFTHGAEICWLRLNANTEWRKTMRKIPLYLQKREKLNLSLHTDNGYCAALKSIHTVDPQEACESSTRNHSHTYYELSIVVSGNGEHWHDGRMSNLIPGQVFLISPGEYHYYKGFEHLVLQNFMFSKSLFRYLRPFIRELPNYELFFVQKETQPKIVISSALISEFESLLQSIELEYQRSNCNNNLLLFSYIAQLLGKLLVYNSDYKENPRGASEKMQNVLAYMKNHFDQEITLEKLSKICSVSLSSLYRMFCQEFSIAPMRWLLNFRLNRARELLMRTEKNVNDVAYACGFSDPLYFSRQFRKNIGCSPRQYRTHGQGRIEILQGSQYSRDLSFLSSKFDKK